MIPDVKYDNVKNELEYLNNFNSTKGCGVTRMLFSEEELGARNYVKKLMREVGLVVSEDSIGNIYGVLEGSDTELAPVWSGSHIDTVINGGMYDGMVGVIAAIEACRWIKDNHLPHKRNLVSVIFTSEEPTRFGVGCIGSRALTGHLSLEETKHMIDDTGITLYELLTRLNYPVSEFDKIKKKQGDIYALVEMHIEQADKLERLGIPIGVVEGICAPSYINVSVTGIQEHAGSTSMKIRKDSVCASSEIILEVERLANIFNDYCDDETTVGTVGKIQVFPNAPNVIAGKTSFIIDIRDVDGQIKDRFTKNIISFIDKIAEKRNVKIRYEVVTNDIPRRSDKIIIKMIEASCQKLGVKYHKMISGAYHDSLLIAEIAPMAMIFVPSKDGISHDPNEYTSYEDIVRGANVLTQTLLQLSN